MGKSSFYNFVFLALLVLLLFPGCESTQEGFSVQITGLEEDQLPKGGSINLLGKMEGIEEEEVNSYSWSAEEGTFDREDDKKATWTAPSSSGIFDIEVIVETEDGSTVSDVIPVAVGNLVEIEGAEWDPLDKKSTLDLSCQLVEEVGDVSYTWSAEGGSFDQENAGEVTWTAPDTSGFYDIEVVAEIEGGIKAKDEVSMIVGDIEGLIFEHQLSLEGDASQRPQMEVIIRNIPEEEIELDVMSTIYWNDDDPGHEKYKEKLFSFIHYDTMDVQGLDGETLDYNRDTRKYTRDDFENYTWHAFFPVDHLQFDTGSHRTVTVEYELVSNHELWEGFEGDLADFEDCENLDDPDDFWATVLEWFILRPRDQSDGVIGHNTLEIDLPPGWEYAATYSQAGANTVDLGELEYMRWSNDPGWKCFNHSPIMLFNEGPFLMEEKEVAGTVLQDVYSEMDKNRRNHEAGHHYFAFMSDLVGELPVDKVLTFAGPHADGGATGTMEYGNVYAALPYGYGYSAMGKYFTSGAGADIGGGDRVDEPHKWSITRWPDDEYTHLYSIHPTARKWTGSLTVMFRDGLDRALAPYLGSQAVNSYYEDWDVVENRYKDKYIFYLEEVVQEDGSEEEIQAVTGHSFHGQFKGSLTFYYFDHRIQEETGGEKDLSDALQYAWEKTLKGDYECEEELLIEALHHTVEEGIDFKEKVRGYLLGDHPEYEHKFLDLSDYLDIDPDDYLD